MTNGSAATIVESSEQPFSNIKVADFSWVGVGPIVARHLADFGATVVRVESSTRPDTLRLAPPFREGKPGIDRSAFGTVYNTNKLGLGLNLRLPKARELALRLVHWADVVTDSMTPGSLARLGLGYEELRRVKPDIIMYSTTQLGQTGPYRDFGGYGQHGAALAGFHALTGWPDRPAAGLFGAYTDFVAPWFLYTALVAALDYRDRTGEGQYLDQSQVEAALYMLGPQLVEYFDSGHAVSRSGNEDRELYPHGAFRCAGPGGPRSEAQGRASQTLPRGPWQPGSESTDQASQGQPPRGGDKGDPALPSETSNDRWVAIAVRDNADWEALCRTIGREEWATAAELQTAEGRRAKAAEIDSAISVWTAERRPHEAMNALQSVGVPAGAVETCEELFSDAQLLHRGHWWKLEHSVIGEHAYDAPAWKLSRTPAQPRRSGPALGQHTYEICRDILGLEDAQIAALSAEGVFE